MSLAGSMAGSAKAIIKDGFSFPSDREVKIAVFRPDVRVGSVATGGIDEANAEWTATARANIRTAMEAEAKAQGIALNFLGDYEGADAELIDQYRSLFIAVSSSAAVHGVFGNRLPTKLEEPTAPSQPKTYRVDWTLGPDATKLRDLTGADYALFFFTNDSYATAGRKVTSLLVAGLFGVYVPTGVHIGYAGLVDLKTGDLVWFNTDPAMGGDPRETDGAVKRVGQLLAGFPDRRLTLTGLGQ